MEDKLLRDKIQKIFYILINPFVKGLIKIGFTPSGINIIGLLLNIGVAFIFILSAEEGNLADFSCLGWTGGLILFAG
jgi:hypothetical protein